MVLTHYFIERFLLREYQFRFNKTRQELIRESVGDLVNTIDDNLRNLSKEIESKSEIRKPINHIRPIDLHHKFHNVPAKLYQDLRNNPGDPTAFDIALDLRKNSYITGYKLVSMMGWTDYVSRVMHVNWIRGTLRTNRSDEIDNFVVRKIAFKSKLRSKVTFNYGNHEIILLSGQLFPVNHEHYFRSPKDLPLPKYSKIPIPEYMVLDALINYHYFGGVNRQV